MRTTRVSSTPAEPAFDQQFAQHVAEGLSHPKQKWLSAQYLYDDVGSALFEAITALPEYGLTRADGRLLRTHAAAMVGEDRKPLRVVELGSGSGLKTRWILEAAVERLQSVVYTPIDISPFALDLCRRTLETIPGVSIDVQNDSYLPGLRSALAGRGPEERCLVLFLGSTIGNFPPMDAEQLLRDIRQLLTPGDALLVGADLVKPASQLLPAYDDPVGVTAAFNRNLLARINRELGGHFDLHAFSHEARFDRDESRVEMHLRSAIPQVVPIDAIGQSFRFFAGETIWTESSYKFTTAGIGELARSAGFRCATQWVDEEWAFSENLLVAS